MTEKEGKEVKERVRNLVDKIGTAGEGFSVFLGAGASKTVDPTINLSTELRLCLPKIISAVEYGPEEICFLKNLWSSECSVE